MAEAAFPRMKMTALMCGNSDLMIRPAIAEDIRQIKTLADAHRYELGFLRRPSLLGAIDRSELIVAQICADIVGFVEYHNRRDQQTTLYNLVVHQDHRNRGIARYLVNAVELDAQTNNKSWVQLKCPEDLVANDFYKNLGYKLVCVEAGKTRRLNVWRKGITLSQQ